MSTYTTSVAAEAAESARVSEILAAGAFTSRCVTHGYTTTDRAEYVSHLRTEHGIKAVGVRTEATPTRRRASILASRPYRPWAGRCT